MSFVISEQPRELNFNQNMRPALGPNLGPGSYNAEIPSIKQVKDEGMKAAPFGTSARRKLNNPFKEMLYDLTQFRVLPNVVTGISSKA